MALRDEGRPDGSEMGWHGTYLDIDEPQRLVSTEVFEGYPDAEARQHADSHTGRRRYDACSR